MLISITCFAIWLYALIPGQLPSNISFKVQLNLHKTRQLPGKVGHEQVWQQQQQQQQRHMQLSWGQTPDAFKETYSTTFKSAADISVMFRMIGRDVAEELPYVLANIGKLASYFKAAHVVLVENDSADGTCSVFTTWATAFTSSSSHNRAAKLLSFKPVTSGKKNLQVLAQARNVYLQELAKPEYAAVEYLIVVDTDMCFPWDVVNIIKVFNGLLPAAGREWHVLYANGVCGWYQKHIDGSSEEVPFSTPGEERPGPLALTVDTHLLVSQKVHTVELIASINRYVTTLGSYHM
jgi:hypothetical protein